MKLPPLPDNANRPLARIYVLGATAQEAFDWARGLPPAVYVQVLDATQLCDTPCGILILCGGWNPVDPLHVATREMATQYCYRVLSMNEPPQTAEALATGGALVLSGRNKLARHRAPDKARRAAHTARASAHTLPALNWKRPTDGDPT
jgi:hypothetical protein